MMMSDDKKRQTPDILSNRGTTLFSEGNKLNIFSNLTFINSYILSNAINILCEKFLGDKIVLDYEPMSKIH